MGYFFFQNLVTLKASITYYYYSITPAKRERGSLSVNVCAHSRVVKVYPRFHCSERVKESKRERERERKGGRERRRDPSFER